MFLLNYFILVSFITSVGSFKRKDSAIRINLRAVNPNIDIKDYIDAKVDAELGKNILIISSKFDDLKNDFKKELEKTNAKIEKTNAKIDALDEDLKILKKLNDDVNSIVVYFKALKWTGAIITIFLVSYNFATFIKDFVLTK